MTIHLGKTDETLVLQATISLRRFVGHAPLPTFEDYIDCPPRTRLSVDEFAARHGASLEDVHAVKAHCADHGLEIIDHHLARRHIRVRGTVAQHNAAFGIDIQDHRDGEHQYRHHEPIFLPSYLQSMILGVVGLHTQYRPRHALSVPTNTVALTPATVSSLYHYPSTLATNQNVAIYGWGHSISDVYQTLDQWGVAHPNIISISLNSSPHPATMEGNLDVSLVAAFAEGCTPVVYFGDAMADIVGRVIHPESTDPICDVFVICFTFSGGIEAQSLTNNFISTIEPLFEDAAALGVTILVSTGDAGTSNYVVTSVPLTPYPPSSPWVTAVGGTTLGTSSGTISPTNFLEWVWNDHNGTFTAASTGGISEYFAVPSFQLNAGLPVSLKTGNPGRGIPDIAGNACAVSGYSIYLNGSPTVIGGTSVTTPMYGGLIARLNTIIGKPLGFLNSTLYKIGSGSPSITGNAPIRDINGTTGGSQDNGAGADYGNTPGYPVGVGWDACTGLGVPNGQALLAYLQTHNTTPGNVITQVFRLRAGNFPPDAISGLKGTVSGNQLTLTWANDPLATSIQVYTSPTPLGPFTNIKTLSGTAQTVTMTIP